MKTKHRALPRGIELLREHINRNETTLTRFCEDNGLDRFALLRIMNADGARDLRVSVNLAASIERASKGAVPIAAWESEEVDSDDPTGLVATAEEHAA